MFKIVDDRLHSRVLMAHGNEDFTLFAVSLSLADAVIPVQDIVIKHFSGILSRRARFSGL